MANIVSTGGWALVFAVEDVATGKEYALKVIKLVQLSFLQLIFCYIVKSLFFIVRDLSLLMKMQTESLYKK